MNTTAKIDELLDRISESLGVLPATGSKHEQLRSIVSEWAQASASREHDIESFIAGARWARMAGDKAFDEELLKNDAVYFGETGGNIRCRGDGTIRHYLRTAGAKSAASASPPPPEPKPSRLEFYALVNVDEHLFPKFEVLGRSESEQSARDLVKEFGLKCRVARVTVLEDGQEKRP